MQNTGQEMGRGALTEIFLVGNKCDIIEEREVMFKDSQTWMEE